MIALDRALDRPGIGHQPLYIFNLLNFSLWRTYISCISVRNPLLCLPSNPPVMCRGNPPNILTPVYTYIFQALIFIGDQSSDPLNKKYLQSSYTSAEGLCVRKPPSFSINRCPNNFMFGVRVWCPQTDAEYELLWRIFSSNKSVPANRKKGLYTSFQKNEEIEGIFLSSGSEL